MIQNLLDALYEVPDFCRSLVTGKWMIPVIVVLVVFVFVLFFTNKAANFLRKIYALLAALLAVAAYYTRQYPLLWLCVLALALLGVIRLIRHIFVTVRQDRINSKIEAKALAKARKRRGSWQNKKGYSGEAKPLVEDPVLPSAAMKEDSASHAVDAMLLQEEVKASLKEEEKEAEPPKVDYLNRTQIMDSIEKLKDLKDAGVLTEEEYTTKTAELYSRLG